MFTLMSAGGKKSSIQLKAMDLCSLGLIITLLFWTWIAMSKVFSLVIAGIRIVWFYHIHFHMLA